MVKQRVLRHQIHALDFAVLEMEMFLDTHPDDQKALRARQVYRQKRQAAVDEYEQHYGPYIVTTDDIPPCSGDWPWVDGPWPWETKGED